MAVVGPALLIVSVNVRTVLAPATTLVTASVFVSPRLAPMTVVVAVALLLAALESTSMRRPWPCC